MLNKKAFTLIELLIVIGIIAILAAGVIVAINPGRQFAQARDATRESHVNTIKNATLSYQVDNTGSLSALDITTTPQEICQTGASDCTGLANLSELTDYISELPIDPQGGVDSNGTGYAILKLEGELAIQALKAETRMVRAGNWSFTDSRDDQSYKVTLIGDQLWMAANLNIGTRINGANEQTDNGTIEKYCYSDNTANCDTYGGLYQWDEMMQYTTTEGVQGICPNGWHIPTDNEWYILENYLAEGECSATRYGGDCAPAGGKLKEAGDSHWSSEGCGSATCNSSKFTALPGGFRRTDGTFYRLGEYGIWWTSSSSSSTEAMKRNLIWANSEPERFDDDKITGFSVRCLKN